MYLFTRINAIHWIKVVFKSICDFVLCVTVNFRPYLRPCNAWAVENFVKANF